MSKTRQHDGALVRTFGVTFLGAWPEPLRYPVIRLTQAALEAEDRTGRRGAYLRLLDRLKVGFAS